MSRIVGTRAAASQVNRGRGRGQTNTVQPSVRGESVSPSRGTSVRGRGGAGSSRGRGAGTFGGYSTGRGGTVSRGGRGGKMWNQPDMDQNENAEGAASSSADDSVQGRATCAGGYTVISPLEKKRQKVLELAARETQQYEEYKQRNKPTQFSYVGTAGGGELGAIDEASARRQQIQTHNMHSKTSRLLKNEERKSQMKQLEDKELGQKKAEARKKADLNTQREAERANSARSNMRRVNNAFLDRLEAQTKTSTATATATTTQTQQQTLPQGQSQPRSNPSGPLPSRHAGQQRTTSSQAQHFTTSTPARQYTSSIPVGQRTTSTLVEQHATPMPSGQRATPAGGKGSQVTSSYSSVGPQPRVSESRMTTSSTAPSYSDRHAITESFPQAESSFSEPPADAEFFDNLRELVLMFPDFNEDMLHSILQQCNGSMEHALELLG